MKMWHWCPGDISGWLIWAHVGTGTQQNCRICALSNSGQFRYQTGHYLCYVLTGYCGYSESSGHEDVAVVYIAEKKRKFCIATTSPGGPSQGWAFLQVNLSASELFCAGLKVKNTLEGTGQGWWELVYFNIKLMKRHFCDTELDQTAMGSTAATCRQWEKWEICPCNGTPANLLWWNLSLATSS